VQQAAGAANAPLVRDGAGGDALAHGGAAERQHLQRSEGGVAGHVNLEAAVEAAGVEDYGLLRQPVEPGAGREGEAGLDAGRGAERAIDALGGVVATSADPGPAVRCQSSRSPPVTPPAVLISTTSGAGPAGRGRSALAQPS
jgi:hypothetical protein